VKGTNVKHTIFPTAGTYGFWINPLIAPTNDERVRKAILMGTDRMKIGAGIGGDPSYATVQYALPGALGYDKAYKPYAYNPTEAKKLLADAGFANGLEIELIHPAGYAPAEISALAVQEQLKAIGITVKIRPLAPTDFTPTWGALKSPMAVTATGGEADPYVMLDLRFFGPQKLLDPKNDVAFRAAMAKAADPTLTKAEREKAYVDLSHVTLDQATFAPIGFRPGQTLCSPRLIGCNDQPHLKLSDTANVPRYLAIAAG
jgi:peptide/nickel transport system substrate-binding protein